MQRSFLVLIISVGIMLYPAAGIAQDYELGVGGGGSFYTSQSVTGSDGTVDAGLDNGFAFSAWMSHDMYKRLGGEVRYTFQNNDLKLSGSGDDAKFAGRTHTVHYEVQVYFTDPEAKVRPFVSAGGGGKYYQGTGEEQAYQPHQDYALLTRTSEWKPMVTFGGGIKVRLGSKASLRAEVKDYYSPIPTKVIQPVAGAALNGWIHDIVPMIGVGFRF